MTRNERLEENVLIADMKARGFLGNYFSLKTVLREAIEQAESGKGKERHAEAGEPFERQIICEVARRVGLGYPLGQAVKKIYESQRLGGVKGMDELLGAINYVAAAYIVMQERVKAEYEKEHDEFSAKLDRTADKMNAEAAAGIKGNPLSFERQAKVFAENNPPEGCEELVQKDAPQSKAELYQRIVDANPALYGRGNHFRESTKMVATHAPTGEELAELTQEEADAGR